eukprot:jgi/Mesvir1/11331/Mv16253-RA.1
MAEAQADVKSLKALRLYDTHAHMCSEAFEHDLGDVLARAEAEGVARVCCVTETLAEARRVFDLCERHPGLLRPCVGLHPVHVASLTDAQLVEELNELTRVARQHQHRLVAIGEVGLDFCPWVLKLPVKGNADDEALAKAEAIKERQKRALLVQVTLANELGLPITVHSRNAGKHTLDLLRAAGARLVVMHAFDGKPGYAADAAAGDPGYYFSVPPSAARPGADKRRLVTRVPLDRLLLESDAPALGVVRDERNEPRWVTLVLGVIAEIKGVRRDEVARAIEQNTRVLFPCLFDDEHRL